MMNLIVLEQTTSSSGTAWWAVLLWCLLTLVIGLVLGFFISREVFKRQLKKNPPIDEKTIKAIYMQMGRKPSEAQIRAVMNKINNNNK